MKREEMPIYINFGDCKVVTTLKEWDTTIRRMRRTANVFDVANEILYNRAMKENIKWNGRAVLEDIREFNGIIGN